MTAPYIIRVWSYFYRSTVIPYDALYDHDERGDRASFVADVRGTHDGFSFSNMRVER